MFDLAAAKHFEDVMSSLFTRPLLFSDWLTHEYEAVARVRQPLKC